jgi:hypothetical protein
MECSIAGEIFLGGAFWSGFLVRLRIDGLKS